MEEDVGDYEKSDIVRPMMSGCASKVLKTKETFQAVRRVRARDEHCTCQ